MMISWWQLWQCVWLTGDRVRGRAQSKPSSPTRCRGHRGLPGSASGDSSLLIDFKLTRDKPILHCVCSHWTDKQTNLTLCLFQLRYLQTLNSISAENNSTIVFPVPIDIMSTFMSMHQKQVWEKTPSESWKGAISEHFLTFWRRENSKYNGSMLPWHCTIRNESMHHPNYHWLDSNLPWKHVITWQNTSPRHFSTRK